MRIIVLCFLVASITACKTVPQKRSDDNFDNRSHGYITMALFEHLKGERTFSTGWVDEDAFKQRLISALDVGQSKWKLKLMRDKSKESLFANTLSSYYGLVPKDNDCNVIDTHHSGNDLFVLFECDLGESVIFFEAMYNYDQYPIKVKDLRLVFSNSVWLTQMMAKLMPYDFGDRAKKLSAFIRSLNSVTFDEKAYAELKAFILADYALSVRVYSSVKNDKVKADLAGHLLQKWGHKPDVGLITYSYFLETEQFEAAEESLKLAIKKYHRSSSLYVALLYLNQELNDPQEQVKFSRLLIEADPSDYRGFYYMLTSAGELGVQGEQLAVDAAVVLHRGFQLSRTQMTDSTTEHILTDEFWLKVQNEIEKG